MDDRPRAAPQRCVLLADARVRPSRGLEEAIRGSRTELAAVVETWPELLLQLTHLQADVTVIDLALTGRAGVRLIAAVKALVPDCEVLLVSELRGFDLVATEAGADAIIAPEDLRPLTTALVRMAGRATEVVARPPS